MRVVVLPEQARCEFEVHHVGWCAKGGKMMLNEGGSTFSFARAEKLGKSEIAPLSWECDKYNLRIALFRLGGRFVGGAVPAL